jgi:hypothetical protein
MEIEVEVFDAIVGLDGASGTVTTSIHEDEAENSPQPIRFLASTWNL